MTYVQIETRNGMINLDGYSRNKTLKGALKDLAREVAKIDAEEGKAIADNIAETAEMVAAGMPNVHGCYYIEAEEVPCARREKYLDGDENNLADDNVVPEYADGHWYLYIRFCAPEQKCAEQEAEQTASAPSTTETGNGIKIKGLRKASSSTCRWHGYTQIFFDRDTNQVWTVDHSDRGSWTEYHDPAVILICNAYAHMTQREIAERISDELTICQEVERLMAEGYTRNWAEYMARAGAPTM